MKKSVGIISLAIVCCVVLYITQSFVCFIATGILGVMAINNINN